ncbi:MAG: response regulator [Phycisphaeraceae bacterium JB051]
MLKINRLLIQQWNPVDENQVNDSPELDDSALKVLRSLANTSVAMQVRLAMFLVLIMCLALGGVCYMSLARIQKDITVQLVQHEELTRPTAHISVQTLQCRRYEKDMFLNVGQPQRFEDYRVRWAMAVEALTRSIAKYRESVNDPQQVLIAEKWLANVTVYQHEMYKIIDEILEGRITTPQQANMAITPSKNTIRSIIINSFSVFDHEFALARIAQQNLLIQTANIEKIISLTMAVILILCIIALVIIPQRIVGPLRSLRTAASQLRDGNLSCRLSEDYPDNEMGQLAITFNQMAQRLESNEKKLLQAKLNADELNQAKTRFLMNMSHELRTPLTAILGFAELLDDENNKEESIDAIIHSGQHLLKIVNDLLQLTEIETDQFKLELRPLNICELMSEMVEQFTPMAHEKQLELIVSNKSGCDCHVVADWQRLQSVFYHLIENAIKFTQQGHVQLRCDKAEDSKYFIFEIKDTGVGMSSQQISQAGQLFRMGDDSANRMHGGTGTGLALCKRLIEYMGGKLSITSQPSIGTTVLVHLPCVMDNLKLPKTDSQPSGPSHVPQFPESRSRKRVLVAEDTPEIQKLIKTLLTNINIQVDLADNGQMALDYAMRSHLNDQAYDLVIMDMQMPVMDGYTATRQLRLQGYQYPIVALTAHSLQGDRQKCLDAGCDDYMSKPIDPAMFTRYVRHWLEHPLIRVI